MFVRPFIQCFIQPFTKVVCQVTAVCSFNRAKQTSSHKASFAIFSAVLLLSTVLMTGCQVSWPFSWPFGAKQHQIDTAKPLVQDPPVETKPAKTLTVYFSKNVGNTVIITSVKRVMPSEAQHKTDPLTFAIEKLLAGPTAQESAQGVYSEIPKGTALLKVNHAAQAIRINVSKQFIAGGGSNTMQQRFDEIAKTAQAVIASMPKWQNKPLFIDVDGKELTALGGEGLEPNQTAANQTQPISMPNAERIY